MTDLMIVGGTVVSAGVSWRADVPVEGEWIAAIEPDRVERRLPFVALTKEPATLCSNRRSEIGDESQRGRSEDSLAT